MIGSRQYSRQRAEPETARRLGWPRAAPWGRGVWRLTAAAAALVACSPAEQPSSVSGSDAPANAVTLETERAPHNGVDGDCAAFEATASGDGAPTIDGDAAPPPAAAEPVDQTHLARVRRAARELLEEGDPTVWGERGRLTPAELSNPFQTIGPEGVEAFNVLDSSGYVDDRKCNLLAFELAYRAGLQVPLIGRSRGWGYPGPHVIVQQLRRGRLVEQWANRVRTTQLAELQALTERGAALMLVGEAPEEPGGHVGLADEIHRVEHDDVGRVALVEYTGWEANRDDASRARRTWRIGRFVAIHFLELRDPPPGEDQVVAMGFGPLRHSMADAQRHLPESRTIGGGHRRIPLRPDGSLPELPVVHGLLGPESGWGQVVDVDDITRRDDGVREVSKRVRELTRRRALKVPPVPPPPRGD